MKYGGWRFAARGSGVVYDIVVTATGMVHGLIAVSWMGIHVTNEMFLLPEIANAQKLADAPGMRNMKRISIVGSILGLLTLLSGITFMFVKWGFDFGRYAEPEPRTVVIALFVIVFVMVMGMALLRPLAMNIGKTAATLKPMDEFPVDMKAKLQKLRTLLHVSSAGVVVAFMLMILAINGGI